MKNLFLLHHLGLGDHIICNGLVRSLSEQYDCLIFPVKIHNLNNIKTMLSDMENIDFIAVKDDNDMINQANKYKNIFELLRLGCFEKPNFINANEQFCQSFYRQANITYDFRWSKYYVPYDESKENYLMDSIDSSYVFIHDDASRNYFVKEKYINGNIYRPKHNLGNETKNTIFDYRKILQKADEIHCMDSSFAAMIDHMPELIHKKKYIHRYIRNSSHNPIYRNGWTILYE